MNRARPPGVAVTTPPREMGSTVAPGLIAIATAITCVSPLAGGQDRAEISPFRVTAVANGEIFALGLV